MSSSRPARSPSHALRSFGRAVSWHRRKLAVLAAIGAVLTGISAAAPAHPPTTPVVRAASQLDGGAVLKADDLVVEEMVAENIPDGAAADPALLVGETLASPVAAGQVLTPLVLARARSVPPGRVLAPLTLPDGRLARQLRAGDRIDVLAADEDSEVAYVVATAARVVTVPQVEAEAEVESSGAFVLVDVDAKTAAVLARAAVSTTLSIVWRR